jgi:hypothetical protein
MPAMRGMDERNGALFSYVSPEERIPARHPLRNRAAFRRPAIFRTAASFQSPLAPGRRLLGRLVWQGEAP